MLSVCTRSVCTSLPVRSAGSPCAERSALLRTLGSVLLAARRCARRSSCYSSLGLVLGSRASFNCTEYAPSRHDCARALCCRRLRSAVLLGSLSRPVRPRHTRYQHSSSNGSRRHASLSVTPLFTRLLAMAPRTLRSRRSLTASILSLCSCTIGTLAHDARSSALSRAHPPRTRSSFGVPASAGVARMLSVRSRHAQS